MTPCKYTEPVIFSENKCAIIDFAKQTRDAAEDHFVGCISGKSLEDIVQETPDAVVIELDIAIARQEQKMRSDIVEIDSKAFYDALGALPPGGWKSTDGVESFYMTERLCHRVATFYAQCDDRYFTFADVAPMTGSAIAERVKEFIRMNPSSPIHAMQG